MPAAAALQTASGRETFAPVQSRIMLREVSRSPVPFL